MLALEAGKNVLCEKPMTITAAQSQALVKKARLKNLFLMEAVWTRFFPLSEELRNIIKSGAIGNVMRTIGETSRFPTLGKSAHNSVKPISVSTFIIPVGSSIWTIPIGWSTRAWLVVHCMIWAFIR